MSGCDIATHRRKSLPKDYDWSDSNRESVQGGDQIDEAACELASVSQTPSQSAQLIRIQHRVRCSKRCWGELEPDLLKRLAVSRKKRIQMVLDAAGKTIDR